MIFVNRSGLVDPIKATQSCINWYRLYIDVNRCDRYGQPQFHCKSIDLHGIGLQQRFKLIEINLNRCIVK